MNIPLTVQTLSSLNLLTGKELAQLQAFLITNEKEPGGPYIFSDSTKESVLFNAKVYQLYKEHGIELTGAHAYVHAQAPTLPRRLQTLVMSYLATPPTTPLASQNSSFSLLTDSLNDVLPTSAIDTIKPLVTALQNTDSMGEISQLSKTYAACVKSSSLNPLSLDDLSKANLYAWAAYSLYDTSIDEVADPAYIAIANLLARESQRIYGTNPRVGALFKRVDVAMLNELSSRAALSYTRSTITFHGLPPKIDLEYLLSERSIVHILGPLLLTKASKSEMALLEKALSQYCAARQLLDDIHDWREDLEQNRYTYVIHRLVSRAGLKKEVAHPKKQCLSLLQTAFWEKELALLLKKVISLTTQSESALYTLPFLNEPTPFIARTCGTIQQQAIAALNRHRQEKDYLRFIGAAK